MKIADASVVYKWYVTENETREALDLLEDFNSGIEKLAVPDLILYELANALRYSRKLNAKDVESALENFTSLGMEIITPNEALLKEAVRLAINHDVTVYDAVYVALAKSLGCELITADKKLQHKLTSLHFIQTL